MQAVLVPVALITSRLRVSGFSYAKITFILSYHGPELIFMQNGPVQQFFLKLPTISHSGNNHICYGPVEGSS